MASRITAVNNEVQPPSIK